MHLVLSALIQPQLIMDLFTISGLSFVKHLLNGIIHMQAFQNDCVANVTLVLRMHEDPSPWYNCQRLAGPTFAAYPMYLTHSIPHKLIFVCSARTGIKVIILHTRNLIVPAPHGEWNALSLQIIFSCL